MEGVVVEDVVGVVELDVEGREVVELELLSVVAEWCVDACKDVKEKLGSRDQAGKLGVDVLDWL